MLAQAQPRSASPAGTRLPARRDATCFRLGAEPGLWHTRGMDKTSISAAGAIDTFLVLLIGIGPKIALVPFLEMTASLGPAAKRQVLRKMLTTAATVAVLLMVLGELLRALLHCTIGSL